MKRLFLSAADKWIDTEKEYETFEDAKRAYSNPIFSVWEEPDRFCLKVVSTHNENNNMKGRGKDGWYY